MTRTHISKTIALVVLLQLCAVAKFPLLTIPSSLVHAQGLPLIRNYAASEYGGHNRNYDIEIGEDGTVYVANFEGLLYYDRARWRMIHTSDISRVTVVYRDSRNTIWVGGYNCFARLQKRPNGELHLQQISREGLFKGEVMEIFEEGEAVQFVVSDSNIYEVEGYKSTPTSTGTLTGTDGSVPTVVLKKHTNANFQIGVESDIVSLEALKEDDEDVLLDDITQTEELGGGLHVKVKKNNGLIVTGDDGRTLYTITEANGLCSNQVSYIAYDGHGLLWGVTAHGIFSIEIPSVYSYLLPKDGLTGEIHAITAYDGKTYVGGTNGLFVVGSRQCHRITDINNICWTLCHSRVGLLAATSSGIYKIALGGHISRLTSNATTAMLVDGDKVYAGEPDGVWLYQLEQGNLVRGKASVAHLPLVTEIRQDAHGNLWFKNVYDETVGTDPGIQRKPLDELPNSLLKPLGNIVVEAQYRHGPQIWIGGDEIVAVIDTDKKDLAKLTDCRTVRFRSIVMGSDSVLWGGYGNMPDNLPQLGSNEGNLHFFYALDYAPLSGKTLYRYRLNKSKWSAWTEKQDVEFLNLPYGSFTLCVQAQLANGELSEVTTIGFRVAYPLLMRWYMMVIYLIAIAYLFYLLFRYRLKRLQKDKNKLEHIVEKRTADLRNAQHELIRQEKMASVGKLTEGLIDRILNPMNYIINFSKMSNDLLKDLKENIDNTTTVKANGQVIISEDDYEDTLDVLGMLTQNLQSVEQYGHNTTRTLKAMEELLKDRTGGYVEMDLLPVLQKNEEMINAYFAKEKAEYHIQITFNIPASGLSMPIHGNPDMLSKTIMSILGNAVYAVVKKSQKVHSDSSKGGYVPQISLSATISPFGLSTSTGRANQSPHGGPLYVLKIRDNGIGIEEKILGKVFDPFFTTKTTGEAAGVGLYLSREIIQNHGGDISVTSVKDEYTELTITLPKMLKTTELSHVP